MDSLRCRERPTEGADKTRTVVTSMERVTRRAKADPVLLRDMRVLNNLLAIEDRYLPSPSYFKVVQKDIEPWMRIRVASWMLEVCEEQKCEEEVFPVAMNLLDRVLSILNICRSQLQLLGTAAMYIASKLRETEPLSSQKLVIYTDHSVKLHELMRWETLVLKMLKWDISCITPHDFLEQILTRLPLTSQDALTIQRHAQTFIALCLATEFKFALYPPSMIAAASVCTALQGLLGRKWCSDINLAQRLQEITNIEHDCLHSCQEQIEKTLSRHLPQSVDGAHGLEGELTPPSTPEKAIPQMQPTTPTDVRDIDYS